MCLVRIQQQLQHNVYNNRKSVQNTFFGLKKNSTGPEKYQCDPLQSDFIKTYCLCLFDEI